MKTKSKVGLGVILALGVTAGMVLFVDLDYSRYADTVTDTITETVTETAQAVSVEIEQIPKIKVFTGCADLYAEIEALTELYDTELKYKTIGENQWFFEKTKEFNPIILEHNCQEWWMAQQ